MKKLKIKAFRNPYPSSHLDGNGNAIINNRIDCSEKDNILLHTHYGAGYDYILEYWTKYWHKSHNYIHVDDLLRGSLQFHPSRIKDKKTGKKKTAYGVGRFTHHKDFRQDGKYYTHEHIFKMMIKKINSKWPGAKHTLADWNEGQYRRINTYIKWVQDWDKHHNAGLKVNDLEKCKVLIKWLRDDLPVNSQ